MKTKSRRTKRTFAPEFPDEKTADQLGSIAAINAISVGSSVFQLEQVIREQRTRRLVIPIYRSSGTNYDLSKLGTLLHDLIVFTLVEDVDVDFREVQRAEQQHLWGPQRVENVCLFSGGVDSYAGILISQQALGSLEGAFCAHSDQARIIHIVAELQRKVLGARGVSVTKLSVPSIGARGYAQLRGFLYLLSAGGLVDKLNSRNVVVTECGPTMYQPRFSPLDSVTMTTHPFVVKTAQQAISFLLGRSVNVITPFENLTKAEVVALCPSKEGLRYTHSCISQRFGTHDGTCYGCVIRRLATTAAGVNDVKYDKNPISDSSARAGNLYSLLSFCADVLVQYRRMEEFEIGMIEAYHKRDLFRRFALDNFAAIHRLLSERKRVVPSVRQIYDNVKRKVTEGTLEDRLLELSTPSVKANFSEAA